MTSAFFVASGSAAPVKEGSQDWFMIMDMEEGENLASAIVDSVVNRGQEVLFEKHIESQVLPYAVQFAKGTLLKMVQWQFFKHDSGEITSTTWEPDEEPRPAIIDSWARGAIPVKKMKGTVPPAATTKKTRNERAEDVLMTSSDMLGGGIGSVGSAVLSASHATTRGSSAKSPPTKVASSTNSISSKITKANSVLGSKIVGSNTKTTRRGKSGQVQHNSDLNELSAAVAAERAIIEENKRITTKIQGIEKEAGKAADVGYDSEGRIILVKRAGACKLVTQGVKARLVAPEETALWPTPPQQPSSDARGADLTAVTNHKTSVTAGATKAAGKSVARTLKTVAKSVGEATTRGSISNANSVRFAGGRGGGDGGGSGGLFEHSEAMSASRTTILGSTSSIQSVGEAGNGNGFVPDASLDIPLLSETMRLAPGVTLKEGDVVKRGPPPVGVNNRMYVANAARKSSSVVVKQTVASTLSASHGEELDPVLSSVLSKAKPTLRPIPFPALTVRETVDVGSNSNVYKKLPNIKA